MSAVLGQGQQAQQSEQAQHRELSAENRRKQGADHDHINHHEWAPDESKGARYAGELGLNPGRPDPQDELKQEQRTNKNFKRIECTAKVRCTRRSVPTTQSRR